MLKLSTSNIYNNYLLYYFFQKFKIADFIICSYFLRIIFKGFTPSRRVKYEKYQFYANKLLNY